MAFCLLQSQSDQQNVERGIFQIVQTCILNSSCSHSRCFFKQFYSSYIKVENSMHFNVPPNWSYFLGFQGSFFLILHNDKGLRKAARESGGESGSVIVAGETKLLLPPTNQLNKGLRRSYSQSCQKKCGNSDQNQYASAVPNGDDIIYQLIQFAVFAAIRQTFKANWFKNSYYYSGNFCSCPYFECH